MEASSPFVSGEELRALPGVVRGLRLGPDTLMLWHSDGAVSVATRGPDGQLWVDRRGVDGKVARVGPLAPAARPGFATRAGGTGAGSEPQDRVVARTAGTVSRVHVAAGEAVVQGQKLITIELMKVELHVEAPRACTVASVEVRERQPIEKGSVLLRLA